MKNRTLRVPTFNNRLTINIIIGAGAHQILRIIIKYEIL